MSLKNYKKEGKNIFLHLQLKNYHFSKKPELTWLLGITLNFLRELTHFVSMLLFSSVKTILFQLKQFRIFFLPILSLLFHLFMVSLPKSSKRQSLLPWLLCFCLIPCKKFFLICKLLTKTKEVNCSQKL